MARQSLRKRQRPPEDDLQQTSRQVRKKARHHQVQTDVAVAGQHPSSPPALPSLLNPSEIGPSAYDGAGPIAPGSSPTAPLRRMLTAKNLKLFDKMSSTRTKPSSRRSNGDSLSEGTVSNKATTISDSARTDSRSSAYINTLARSLEDHGIYAKGDQSLLANLEELQRERGVRPSLEPSVFSDGQVEYYVEANSKAVTELDTERGFVPAILGQCRLPRSGNIAWDNMSSLTEGETAAPQPDLYYGVPIRDINILIRHAIGPLILPSTTLLAPAAPYLVFETQGREGSLEVVKYQATHSGAAAARAQFALKNYGLVEPVYDSEVLADAWTYTCSPGDLTRYAVRVSAPEPGFSGASYHMTHIKTYHMTESAVQFRSGVSAFRHCKDEAYKRARARLATAHERLRRMTSQAETRVPGGAPPSVPEAQNKDAGDEYLAVSVACEIQADVSRDTNGLGEPRLLDAGVDSLQSVSPPNEPPRAYSTMNRPRRNRRRPKKYS